jgi:hypothetical protein
MQGNRPGRGRPLAGAQFESANDLDDAVCERTCAHPHDEEECLVTEVPGRPECEQDLGDPGQEHEPPRALPAANGEGGDKVEDAA